MLQYNFNANIFQYVFGMPLSYNLRANERQFFCNFVVQQTAKQRAAERGQKSNNKVNNNNKN